MEELNIRKKQLEDAEIIKTVRSMKLGSRDMLAFLESIQNGAVPVPLAQTGVETEQAGTGNNSRPEDVPAEREDKEDEEKD